MTRLESYYKGFPTFLALGIVGSSTEVPISSSELGEIQVTVPVMVFLAVVFLHWQAWHLIVPGYRILGSDSKAFFIFPIPRDAFSDLLLLGYGSVAIYCLNLSGYLKETRSDLFGPGQLVFGLLLIGVGIAGRLRSVVHELQQSTKTPESLSKLEDANI